MVSSKQDQSKKDTLLNLERLQEQLKLQQDELFQQQRELLLQEPNLLSTASPKLIANKPIQSHSSQFQSSNPWSFTQGLIIGQVSVIFIIIVFIKFFVFADPTPTSSKTKSRVDTSGVIVRRDKKKANDDSEGGSNGGNGDGSEDNEKFKNSNLSSILEKTYYDVDTHSPETLDWFNVLIAQTISQFRSEAILSDNIYHSLTEFLETADLPEYLDKINITEIDIGDDFPICSNCRIKHSQDGSGRLEAKIDVDLADTLTLGIETKLLLNHPRPLTAVLPVQLSVSIVRFSGCLTVSLINTNDQEFADLKISTTPSLSSETSTPEPNDDTVILPHTPPQASSMASSSSNIGRSSLGATPLSQSLSMDSHSNIPSSPKKSKPTSTTTGSSSYPSASKKNDDSNDEGTALMFSFSPDYRLEFTVKSLIGSRAKLQDVPKISSLIENKLRSWFIERCIEPRFQVVKLPSIWPRRKNTREPIKTKTETE
ncbi:maintenance of mitochondrial morphology protein 1 [Scheffersomyces coipomensis]|uniref:maintenance of mitochondrial morphology protein 1 n=1 Tax=Scheffersomyces coipomensis TaxID=1788519 RepID=UPI00315CF283